MDQKTDKRVIKTKHAIYKAFVELLNEKDINQITITDVAKKANINRKLLFCKWVVIIRLFTRFRAHCISISHSFWRQNCHFYKF